MSMFQKATRKQARARVGFDGPSGAGKTWTSLEWASVLGKRIAVIDTERGSASLYSDRFSFDVVELHPPFDPARYVAAVKAAETEGYDVLVIDSLSHAWEGEGGVRDIVDVAAAKLGHNSWAGWSVGTPAYRHLVDTILAADLHVIATMRSKTEWAEGVENGRKTYQRVGTAPVMRAGIEYEFTLVGDIDLEHRIAISKSRAEPLADLLVQAGRAAEAAETFRSWLQAGEALASRAELAALHAAFDTIEDRALRKEIKGRFVESFGHPDSLTASRLPEAKAWVASATAGEDLAVERGSKPVSTASQGDAHPPASPAPAPASQPTNRRQAPARGEKGGDSESGSAGTGLSSDTDGQAGAEQVGTQSPAPATGEVGPTGPEMRNQRAFFARVRELNLTLSDERRHSLISWATQGAATSAGHLTDEQLYSSLEALERLQEGSIWFDDDSAHVLEGEAVR